MAAVWMLLAKSRFPAELIESSKEEGVRTVSIPFDISAEFVPSLLKHADQKLEQLSFGLSPDAPEFDQIVHRSPVMKKVVSLSRKVALHSVPVLIEGETGTGKELLAKAIHQSSPRRNKPIITINCGALPPDIIESELFGYKKGAFYRGIK
jgi:transcriptional regulator with PAS, ATPase and Fis domain